MSEYEGDGWRVGDARLSDPIIDSAPIPDPTPIVRRTDLLRATQVAEMMLSWLLGKEGILRRPVEYDDLTSEELRAFGFDAVGKKEWTWPPSFEHLKRVAGLYLQGQGRVPDQLRGAEVPKPEVPV